MVGSDVRHAPRRGASLLVAVALVAVAGAVLAAATRAALLHRRAVAPAVAAVQADLLADAAARRPAGSPLPWSPALPGGTAGVSFDDGGRTLTAAVAAGGHTARARRAARGGDPGMARPPRRPLPAPKPDED